MLQCAHCQQWAKTRTKLKRHILLKHDEAQSIRTFQGFSLRPQYTFSISKMIENNMQPNFPPFNPPQLISVRNMKEEDTDCDYCRFKAVDIQELELHLSDVHTVERELSCDRCLFIANSTLELEKHLNENHQTMLPCPQFEISSLYLGESDLNERRFPCTHCGFRALHMSHLRDHIMARHSQVRPYACKLCSYTTVRARQLRYHMAAKHKEENLNWKCNFCDYRSERETALRKHKRDIHGEDYIHPCPLCEFISLQEICLREHLLTKHSFTHPYICNQCGHCAITDTLLKRHILSKHKNKNTFKCAQCNFIASSADLLRRHTALHLPPKRALELSDPLPCSSRDEPSSSKTNINNFQPQTIPKIFQCAYCSCSFTFRGKLKDHIAFQHAIKTTLTIN